MHYIVPSIFRLLTPTSLNAPSPVCIFPSMTGQYLHIVCAFPPIRYKVADKSCPSFTYVLADFRAASRTNDTFQSTTESAPRSFRNYTADARNLSASL